MGSKVKARQAAGRKAKSRIRSRYRERDYPRKRRSLRSPFSIASAGALFKRKYLQYVAAISGPIFPVKQTVVTIPVVYEKRYGWTGIVKRVFGKD